MLLCWPAPLGQFQGILHLYAITFEGQFLNGKWPVAFSIINYTLCKLDHLTPSIMIFYHYYDVVGLNIRLLKSYYFDTTPIRKRKYCLLLLLLFVRESNGSSCQHTFGRSWRSILLRKYL